MEEVYKIENVGMAKFYIRLFVADNKNSEVW